MIILDTEDQRQTKDPTVAGLTLRFPEKAVARSDSPLPDYETSEARQKFLLQETSSRKIFDKRLLRAILYALIIYVALSALIGIPIVLLRKNKNSAEGVSTPPPTWVDDVDPGSSFGLTNAGFWLLGNTTGCDWNITEEDYEQDIFTASSQHSLSPSGSFIIRSNASCEEDRGGVSGSLTVGMNPSSSETQVILQVNATSSSSRLFRDTGACFNDAGNNRGLFVYASRNISSLDFLALNISILFPHTKPNATVDNFITYLPGFAQTFGNLTGRVYFNNLVIEGSWGDVLSTALAASKLSVKNSFASIRGTYQASASISLDTIKGNLTTDITLISSRAPCTYLTLDTGDGEIDARVTLAAPTTHNFFADVKTFNGPLSLHVAHDPSTNPMPLQLNVQNNLASTKVYLDKKYEGLFNVQTKLDKVTLQQYNATDPLGQGRQRSVIFDQNSTDRVRGWVGWGQRPGQGPGPGPGPGQGQVKIIGSLSPVLLQLS